MPLVLRSTTERSLPRDFLHAHMNDLEPKIREINGEKEKDPKGKK